MPYIMSEKERAEMFMHEILSPSTKDEVIDQAIRRGASEDMIGILDDLPEEVFELCFRRGGYG